jgi:hypothetical protein
MCGDANEDELVNATDALLILKRAVGLIGDGDCPAERCDVNSDEAVNATDALLVLKSAVGLEVDLVCA